MGRGGSGWEGEGGISPASSLNHSGIQNPLFSSRLRVPSPVIMLLAGAGSRSPLEGLRSSRRVTPFSWFSSFVILFAENYGNAITLGNSIMKTSSPYNYTHESMCAYTRAIYTSLSLSFLFFPLSYHPSLLPFFLSSPFLPSSLSLPSSIHPFIPLSLSLV